MNTPNNKRKRESRERIEKTFLQMVQTKEVRDISVTDICKAAKLNRTTFYSNYIDIYDLEEKVYRRMINEYAQIYENDTEAGQNPKSYLKMFKHIKDNQVFYKTFFKLGFDINYEIVYFDKELAAKFYDNKYIDYHIEFFRAGITAVIKKWLDNGCDKSPEEILEILRTEYTKKEDEIL